MRPEPVDVFVSIGSNVAPERNIRFAVRALQDRFGVLRCSPVYRNPPVGFDGDDFLNLVAGFRTREAGDDVIDALERVHDLAGRERGGERFGPRVLDIDLLLYGDAEDPALKVPRDDIERYAFVLRPLADIEPDRRHPVSGVSMADMWSRLRHEAPPMERIDLPLDGAAASENVTQFPKTGRVRA